MIPAILLMTLSGSEIDGIGQSLYRPTRHRYRLFRLPDNSAVSVFFRLKVIHRLPTENLIPASIVDAALYRPKTGYHIKAGRFNSFIKTVKAVSVYDLSRRQGNHIHFVSHNATSFVSAYQYTNMN